MLRTSLYLLNEKEEKKNYQIAFSNSVEDGRDLYKFGLGVKVSE